MSPPDETDGRRRPRARLNRDLLAALTSGFVGALALFASLYNVYLQRQQIRRVACDRRLWLAELAFSAPLSLLGYVTLPLPPFSIRM